MNDSWLKQLFFVAESAALKMENMIEVSSLIGGCWAKEGSLGVGS